MNKCYHILQGCPVSAQPDNAGSTGVWPSCYKLSRPYAAESLPTTWAALELLPGPSLPRVRGRRSCRAIWAACETAMIYSNFLLLLLRYIEELERNPSRYKAKPSLIQKKIRL